MHASLRQSIDDGDQVPQATTQVAQFPDHERVVLPEHQHRLFQAFPLCPGASCPVLEDFLASGTVQRVVLRHLSQLIRACRDKPLTDNLKHPLDYGKHGEFPWKAFFQNPSGHAVPEQVLECFDAQLHTLEMGADYRPQEFIFWV